MAQQKRKPVETPSIDEEMRALLAEIRLMEGSARILQSRLDLVSAALSETLTAVQTLEGTKGKPENSEILIPIGSGSFVRAKLADAMNLLIGIGAGVVIEKTVEDSIKDLRLRSSELEKARSSVTQQLGQILDQTEMYRSRLGELVRKKGGGAVEIV
jgi:prefoldin alpha subunit